MNDMQLTEQQKNWLAAHPEHEPYRNKDGSWAIPYLCSGAGGFGGGVGEYRHGLLSGVVALAMSASA